MVENRDSFFARLEPFHSPSTLLDIQLAYLLAKFGHRAQTRSEVDDEGRPLRYFEHVRRVALILIDEMQITDPAMVMAALLHDGIEDTRVLTPALIEHCFGTDVVTMVKTLSKVPKEGYLERFHMSVDWRPYMIKACDRLDNLRSLVQATPQFRLKQLRETQEKYIPLMNRLVELTPPIFQKESTRIRDMIANAVYTQLSP